MGVLGYNGVIVMQALAEGHCYGFEVMDATSLPSGTVYPLLRRFEARGLVKSEWETGISPEVAGRPSRRYYELKPEGAALLSRSVAQIRAVVGRLDPQGG